MANQLFDAPGVFVSPAGSDETGEGTRDKPFLSVSRALAALAPSTQASLSPAAGRPIEVLSIAGPGQAAPSKGCREYFVDPLSAAAAPDGTEDAPWPDLESGIAGLTKHYGNGAVPLMPGERIRVLVRGAFSETSIERRKRRNEQLARTIFMLMTVALVVPLAAILGHLLFKAWPILSFSFLFENPRDAMLAGGIWAPLIGTFYLICISLLVAAPIGILAGVYLNEYARDNWATRIVNLAVVNLAGVPSIVHALFGVGAFVGFARMGYSVLAASCTLAIMTLPVIITSTKEALASVPRSFREACWNMGATRWQTIRTIVLPNSTSGILTGVILQVSRAAGETAPILFTGAVFYMRVPDTGWASIFPYTPADTCMALSYHLFALMTQVKGLDGHPEVLEHIQYGTAVVLIGLVLAVNSLSIGLRVFLRSRKKW